MVAIRFYGLDRSEAKDRHALMDGFNRELLQTGSKPGKNGFFFVADVDPVDDVAEVAVFLDGLPLHYCSGGAAGKQLRANLEKVVKEVFEDADVGVFLA